jgi:hypothetical protein
MKTILSVLIIILPLLTFGQKDTTMYFGVNGKMTGFENRVIKKEIKKGLFKKINVVTSKQDNDNWHFLFSEKIKIVNDSVFKIKIRGDEFSGRIIRHLEIQPDGHWKFTDWINERIKRTGYSTSKIPLIFDGEITDFYKNGQIKSISQYKNNELISNKNWLVTGEKEVDNIFYSVDSVPLFMPGIEVLNQHIVNAFKKAGISGDDVNGKIVVGFVVKTDGTISGIRMIKGITGIVDAVAKDAFKTLGGKWKPAQLNGHDVNYLQPFPINFIYDRYDFDYLQLKGSTLYWEIN